MMVLQIGVLLLSFLIIGQAQAQEASQMNMEILKEQVKTNKKLLVANNMNLTDEEAKNFWLLYDGYQKELEQINQRLFTTIKSYANAYNAGKGEISNDIAKKILAEALAADESEVKLRQSYAAKLEKSAACQEGCSIFADRNEDSGNCEIRAGVGNPAG